MSQGKDKNNYNNQDDDSEGRSGSGGAATEIAFRDFLASGASLRDDLLSPDEQKRLLGTHNVTHEGRVKNQKELVDQRKQLKEGKVSLETYRQGLSGASSQYRSHPMLSDKAQFSGIDRQINSLPTENVADSNKEQQYKLENAYRLRFAPDNAPKFNPKPLPR